MPAKPLRILYVEDNPADLQLLQDLLLEVPDHGLEIVNRESLQDVRTSGGREEFDAALLDLDLPDSRGLATYQAIALRYPDLPVIVFTVTDLEDLAVQAVRAGAQDYLIKGHISGYLVVRAIRYAIERMALSRRLAQANELLELRISERTAELATANKDLRAEIEERKRQERALREQRQTLEDILKGLEAAVLVVDVKIFKVVEANALAERLLGLAREEIIGSDCYRLICRELRDTPPEVCPALGKMSPHADFMLKRPDGRLVPVMKTVLPTTINGRPHNIAILIDATERKALERQLALAQKLEAVGQLAAGIAHEINSPVQYIGGNIDFFETVTQRLAPVLEAYAVLESAARSGRDPGPSAEAVRRLLEETRLPQLLEELPQAIEDTKDGVQRIASIVLAMKKFAHPDTGTKKPVDVNAAVQNTITITRNEWKYASDMTTDLDPDLPVAHCMPGDFNQVLLNILVNAAQANAARVKGSADKGRITVTTRHSGDRVLVSVADTGVGIPKENRDRIFEPFFTTKKVGEGTGQGLAITHAIMQRHGGSITFTSEPGAGTTFTLDLPIGAADEECGTGQDSDRSRS